MILPPAPVVHPRWLLAGVLQSNVTPPCWLAWNERRNA